MAGIKEVAKMAIGGGASKEDKNMMMFRVTELGQERLDNNQGDGPELEILLFINNSGSCTISDVTKGIHKNRDKVEFVMKKLSKMGCIKKIN